MKVDENFVPKKFSNPHKLPPDLQKEWTEACMDELKVLEN
jgi:hypothetical protein